MSIYLARNGKMLTRLNGTRYFGSTLSPTPPAPTPSFDEVEIGYQTWMAKNLSIDDGQGGIVTQTVNYGQGNVVEYYYTWDAAVRVAASIQGWRLPSAAAWDTLANTVGSTNTGTKLKSTYGWSSGNGTDNYGFAAFPAGYKDSSSFMAFGSYAIFWTSTEQTSTVAKNRYLDTGALITQFDDNKSKFFSVRLVRGN